MPICTHFITPNMHSITVYCIARVPQRLWLKAKRNPATRRPSLATLTKTAAAQPLTATTCE